MLDINDLQLQGYNFQVLRTDPWIIMIHNFMTTEERNALLSLCPEHAYKSFESHEMKACPLQKPQRALSSNARSQTDAIKRIEDKISRLTRTDPAYQENYQLIKYKEGQGLPLHVDHYEYINKESLLEIQEHGQRCFTALVYVMSPLSGGETYFPHLHLKISPEPGAAVLWFNTDKEGNGDPRTEHGAMPVIKGDKIAVNIWVRTKPFKKTIVQAH